MARSKCSGGCLEAETLLQMRYLASRRILPAQRSQDLFGAVTTPRRGRGLEINDIRAWLEGDDVRHLDRNATARTGVPHVRTFRDDRNRTTLLVADFRPSMLFGTKRAFRSVAAAEALSLIGWQVIGEGSRLGLLSIGPGEPVLVSPANGERAMRNVIGCLVESHTRALEAGNVEDTPLDSALAMAADCMPRAATTVLATALDEPGETFDSVVRSLVHRGTLWILLMSDAFERDRAPGVYPFLTAAGRRGWGRVDRDRLASSNDDRLARLTALGARAVHIKVELEPEAVMPVLQDVIRS